MKTKRLHATALAVVTALGLAAGPVSAQIWNFDSDVQGWQVADFTGTADYTTPITFSPLTYNATGGKSGGYVSSLDPSSGTFFFAAPSASLGDYSGFAGGKLTFSLQTNLLPDWTPDSVIVFRGAGLTIISALGAQPGASWTDYSIDLVAAGFRYDNLSGSVVSATDFASVLGGLSAFYINGEYHIGVQETTGLDSVAFAAAPSVGAVPEPSTYGLIGAALLLLAALHRKKLRR